MKRTLLLFAAVLSLTAPALAVDPCTLLTKADAQKFLGGSVTGGHRGNECTYRLAGTGKNVYAATDATPKGLAYFNAFKSEAKPVAGLGIPAYFAGGSLAILKGSTLVQVGLVTRMSDTQKMNPKLPEVAKLVLSRL